MSKIYARIQDQIVVEIIPAAMNEEGHEIAIADRFHADIVAMIVGADSTVQCGWAYANSVFSAPTGPTLDQLKALKLAELCAAFSASMGALKIGYPDEEIQSWTKQEAEARNYSPTNSASAPLLTAMATARGIPLAELVERVKANADAWTAMSGELIGKRQAYEDAVDAAYASKDASAISAIAWV